MFYQRDLTFGFSEDLLHPTSVIDQAFETRWSLTFALAQQWFGISISVEEWADTWLNFGISGFLTLLSYEKMFGNNEYKFKLYKDIEYVCNSRNNQSIYCNDFIHPSHFYQPLFYKKSMLVMLLIEKNVGTDGFKQVQPLPHTLNPFFPI